MISCSLDEKKAFLEFVRQFLLIFYKDLHLFVKAAEGDKEKIDKSLGKIIRFSRFFHLLRSPRYDGWEMVMKELDELIDLELDYYLSLEKTVSKHKYSDVNNDKEIDKQIIEKIRKIAARLRKAQKF